MTDSLVGLIPAAGLGVRARPYTREIHKGMFSINGITVLERIIAIMRDQLEIRDVYIVTGHRGETITEYFGDGSTRGVCIHYINNENLEKGWAWSVLLAQPYISGPFCLMLCDEYYISSNHAAMLAYDLEHSLGVCAGIHVDDAGLIKKNYAIEHDGKQILGLVEKPTVVKNDLMGTGSFLFNARFFDLLQNAYRREDAVDFITLLDTTIRNGERVEFFELTGTYVNINDRDSLYIARYHDRITHFRQYRLSLLVCSEGDEENIAFTLTRYRELGLFHEIVVVLPQGSELEGALRETNVNLAVCPTGGMNYGEQVRFGLKALSGDILVMTEADYSFASRDVEKLLTYLKEADMVVGTRTTRQLIEQGSTMTGVVRAAHSGLGKLLELLWWNREGRFTDVGCTMRALWRSTYQEIEPQLRSNGPEVLAEMAIECMAHRQRVLEIPVNYFNCSQSLNRKYRNPGTFFRVLGFILNRRLGSLF